jgi:multidrug efflux system membrane fusion protein
MKRWVKWAVALVILLLIAGGVLRALSARKAQQQALAASSAAPDMGLVELAATDVVKAQARSRPGPAGFGLAQGHQLRRHQGPRGR